MVLNNAFFDILTNITNRDRSLGQSNRPVYILQENFHWVLVILGNAFRYPIFPLYGCESDTNEYTPTKPVVYTLLWKTQVYTLAPVLISVKSINKCIYKVSTDGNKCPSRFQNLKIGNAFVAVLAISTYMCSSDNFYIY